MKIYKKIIKRYKTSGFKRTMGYLFFTVFLEKVGLHVDAVFIYKKDGPSIQAGEEFGFKVIQSLHELGDKERASLIGYGGTELIDDFSDSFSRGELCALGYSEQQLGCVCWAIKTLDHPVKIQQPAFLIWRCFTLPDLRGRGLYPLTLSYFCSMLKNQDSFSGPILIESSVFNQSSLKGIYKAGFRDKGKIFRFGGWSKAFDIMNS